MTIIFLDSRFRGNDIENSSHATTAENGNPGFSVMLNLFQHL
ncbi:MULTISPECIES: hypothetical protein [unclassified Rickettsia]